MLQAKYILWTISRCFHRSWSSCVSVSRPESVPRSSLSLLLIWVEGEGHGLLAYVGFCISLLTLQQKWEEAYGLPGMSWGGKEDI